MIRAGVVGLVTVGVLLILASLQPLGPEPVSVRPKIAEFVKCTIKR